MRLEIVKSLFLDFLRFFFFGVICSIAFPYDKNGAFFLPLRLCPQFWKELQKEQHVTDPPQY